MANYLEVYSKEWVLWGDGVSLGVKFNLSGYPFNLDLSEMPPTAFEANQINPDPAPPTPISCKVQGAIITLTLRNAIPPGTSIKIKLTARVLV